MGIVELILIALAVENLADILVNIDLLENTRARFEVTFPKFKKLARCKYCQMFWLSAIYFSLGVPILVVNCFAVHRIAQFFNEFFRRYLNDAPINIFVNKQ